MLQKGWLAQKSARCFYVISSGPDDGFKSYNSSWTPFTIPDNAQFINITCVAPGGPGGSSSTTKGGGGGGSGGISIVLFPAILLPKTIYLQPSTKSKTLKKQPIHIIL